MEKTPSSSTNTIIAHDYDIALSGNRVILSSFREALAQCGPGEKVAIVVKSYQDPMYYEVKILDETQEAAFDEACRERGKETYILSVSTLQQKVNERIQKEQAPTTGVVRGWIKRILGK